MTELVSLKCPNCGAQLPPRAGAASYTCEYCQHVFEVAQPPPPPPPPVTAFAPPAVRVYVTPGVKQPRWIAFAVLFPILMAVGINVFVQSQVSHSIATGIPGVSVAVTNPDGERLLWDSTVGAPVFASIAGRPGFVGRYRVSDQGDALFVAAFDPGSLKRLWKTPPLGSYSDAHDSTHFALAGNRVVVSDYRAELHLYDLANGTEIAVVKLSDRVDEMCGSPDGRAEAWLHTKDGKNLMVEANGTTKPTPRPAYCPASFGGHTCRGILASGVPHATCLGPEKAPRIAAFETKHVLADGNAAVAVGVKAPGTAIPEIAGFDLGGKSVKWQHPLPSGDLAKASDGEVALDDLVGGRYVAPYEMSSDAWHMTAFDVHSGERLWDIELPKVFAISRPETLAVSPTHVLLARTSSLEVFDAKSGALLGAIGSE